MSIILVAVILLARIEAGQFSFNLRFNTQTPGRTEVLSYQQLKSLRAELDHWGLATEVAGLLRLLYKAKLIRPETDGQLTLTPQAYTWLQLPIALSARLLLEAGPTDALSISALEADPRYPELSALLSSKSAQEESVLLEEAQRWQNLFPKWPGRSLLVKLG